MSFINIAIILLSCGFHALWNVLTQTSKNPNLFSGLKGVFILGVSLVFYLIFDINSFPGEILIWALLSGVLHGFYIYCLSKAYQTQDISYVYPIARSAPVFVPLFAWFFLGEMLGPVVLPAIAIILTAVYILHFDGHLIRGFKNLFDAILHRDLRWAFYTLGMVISYSIVDKAGMDKFFQYYPQQPFANGFLFFFLEGFVCFTLYIAYICAMYNRDAIFSAWRADWKKALVAGLATIVSYGLICVALQFESVSSVVAVRQISVVMVVIWGCWKLGESFGQKRMLAAGLMVLGVAIMALGKD